MRACPDKVFLKALQCFAFLLIAVCGHNTFAADCWTDADLSALEKDQSRAVIYVWSPRMALSVLHAAEVASQAQAAGLVFIPLVDSRVPVKEWHQALQTAATLNVSKPAHQNVLQGSLKLCAARLTELDAYQHFPSVFMVHSGKLQQAKWTGAMNAAVWANAFRAGLQQQNPVSFTTPAALQPNQIQIPATASASAIAAVVSPQPADTKTTESCIEANQFVSLPPELAGRGDDQSVSLGAYERISPDGRYVLRSYSGKQLSTVSLIELPEPSTQKNLPVSNVVRITQTPLSNEAFPVQGSWRYIVDTNGQHYTFRDLLVREKKATPYFKGGMSGFYAAAAEVASTYPANSRGPVQIRSLSWPNPDADSDTVGEGMLTARTITVNPEQHRLLADSGRANLCLGRAGIDGTLYSLPMISVDGQHFAALPQRPVNNVATMRVFGFGADGKQCLPRQQFTSASGKVTFGFAPDAAVAARQLADLVYEYRGQAWWYASQAAKPFNLAPWDEKPLDTNIHYRQKIIASAFPGVTRDGRVIYAATWQLCSGATCTDQAGYVVSDPYQSNAYQQHLLAGNAAQGDPKQTQGCIRVDAVLRERADFAKFHGIARQ